MIGTALMQKGEPMRAIDADALMKDICDSLDQMTDIGIAVDGDWLWAKLNDAIDNAPTIEPERRWIPCSERLPDEKDAGILKKLGTEKRSEYVLATVEVKGERMTVTACTYDGRWDWNMKYAFPDFKVVAWMPLPEPYKERRKESHCDDCRFYDEECVYCPVKQERREE